MVPTNAPNIDLTAAREALAVHDSWFAAQRDHNPEAPEWIHLRAVLSRVNELEAERNAARLDGVKRGLEAAALCCLDIAREWDAASDSHDNAADECKAAVAALDAAAIATAEPA